VVHRNDEEDEEQTKEPNMKIEKAVDEEIEVKCCGYKRDEENKTNKSALERGRKKVAKSMKMMLK